jgi:hypothetical protein
MTELTQSFLEISIVGTILSFAVEAIKTKYGTSSFATKGITIGLAGVIGAAVFFLSGTAIWVSILGVLAAASTVYAFFLK